MAELGLLLYMLEEKCASGRWEDALSLVQRLEGLSAGEDPGSAEFLLYHKGYALLELNRPEQAETSLRRLVKIDPSSAHYRLLLADALIRRQSWEAASSELEAGLIAEPDHPGCLCALGWTFYQRGRTRDGRATLEHALELHPQYVPAHLDLGLIAAAEGRWAASEAHLEAARALAPEDAELREILEAVRESRALAEGREGRDRRADAADPSGEFELIQKLRSALEREGASPPELLLAQRMWEDFAGARRPQPLLDAGWAAAVFCACLELRKRQLARAEVAAAWEINPRTLSRRLRKLKQVLGLIDADPRYAHVPARGSATELPSRSTGLSGRVIPVDFIGKSRMPDSVPCPCGSGEPLATCPHPDT
jgi:tetratricopeptide (TPR) repeat protein